MEMEPFPDGVKHVVYADVDVHGHVRYIGKGTRSRYLTVARSYWKRTEWRPARRIVLYRAGSDEAVCVLESVAIKQHLEAGADLLNVRQPSIPDLAAAAEARRREAQARRRRERQAAVERQLAFERLQAEREERRRIEEELQAELRRRRRQEWQQRQVRAAETMERLETLWSRRAAGLEPDAGRGLTEPCFAWRNPFRKLRAAHLRLAGRRVRADYRVAATRWGQRHRLEGMPSSAALAVAEVIAMGRTLPGRAAIVACIVMLIVVVLLVRIGAV